MHRLPPHDTRDLKQCCFMMVSMTIVVATDGSALGNPGPAGWAWFINEENWACGGWAESTNNRAELMAVIDFLEKTSGRAETIHFLCDSQYVVNSATKWLAGWKARGWRKADKKPVLNVDLIKRLDAALQGRTVSFEWVRGHVGHELNEVVDDLARAVATAFARGLPFEQGPGIANLFLNLEQNNSNQNFSTPSSSSSFATLNKDGFEEQTLF